MSDQLLSGLQLLLRYFLKGGYLKSREFLDVFVCFFNIENLSKFEFVMPFLSTGQPKSINQITKFIKKNYNST